MINGHGDDRYRYPNIRANFSSNVYADADTQALISYLSEQTQTVLYSYPEPEPYKLQTLIEEQCDLPTGGCLFTSGATEAIYLIALCYRGAVSAILQPTFSEYADACKLYGHSLRSIHSIDDELPEEVEVVWLCNPNNPTGQVLPMEQLRLLVERHPSKTFVLDQSYEYFTHREVADASSFAWDYPNTLIIHSLTKRYLLPGLRLGYLTGAPQKLSAIRQLRMPWSVNALAISAGEWIVRNGFPETIDRPLLWEQTEYLRNRLGEIGVETTPTDTHFFLSKTPLRASLLKELLAQDYGLLLRDASNFEGLGEHYIRIATQLPEQNEALVSALSQIIGLGVAD